MEKNLLLIAILFFGKKDFAQYRYPATKTVDSNNTYFGTTVKDPYRWLENLNDSNVIKWFKAQAEYTNDVMSKVPGQQTIINELAQLDKVQNVKYENIIVAAKGFVVSKQLPGEQTYKYYYRATPNGKDVLFFDAAAYEKGKVMDVNNFDVSIDGKYAVFNLSEQGKGIGFMRIMEVQTGKWLPEEIKHAGGGFVKDTNDEILYLKLKSDDTRDLENILNSSIMLHIIGTPESNDKEIMSRMKYPELTIDSSDVYVPVMNTFYHCPFMFVQKANVNSNLEMYYAPLSELTNDRISWKPFCKRADEIKSIDAHGSDIYCRTSKGNSHYRLLKVSLPEGKLARATEIYAGDKDWQIGSFFMAKDYMVFRLNKNELIRKSFRYSYATGKVEEIRSSLPGNNTAIYPYAPFSNKCKAYTSGWNEPSNIYEYDLTTHQFSNGPFHVEFNYPDIDNLVVEEVEVPSYDGTLVPLSVVYNRKYFKKDGSNICFLSGYGGYGFSISPVFYPELLPLLNRGVVYAVAHVRGGGEKGEDWHTAGQKTNKPNTWKDFNACAEWIIKNSYTSNQKLVCEGVSAGGILIGRAITERPDLYKVAIPEVGVLNTIRFETTANGKGNIPELGTMKDSVQARALMEMDALYHVKPNTQYPSQLITTGFNDPRVDSWIPGKFAAAMQAANNPATPTLLLVNFKGGHFGGSTVNEQFAATALKFAFLLWQCGDKEFQVK